ncbi:hypothetical protein [Gemmatimonas sp.]|uniref:hypothetical protein n=1 Tax=Gemmatimonas sp. TaxID=1962908 RepID=UPI00356744F1
MEPVFVPSDPSDDMLGDLPPLPTTAFTADGQMITPSEPVWRLRKREDGGGYFNLHWAMLENFAPRMVHLSKLLLASRASQYSASTTKNEFDTLRRLSQWRDQPRLEWSHIDFPFGESWLSHGVANTANAGNDFARLRDLYRYGAEVLLHEDFSSTTLLHLETLRAPGNAKGNAVRAGDPDEGYFTPPEVDAIVNALGRLQGTAEQRATVWLSLELGRNSLQYTLLRGRDLLRFPTSEDPNAPYLYRVCVRRIKKRQPVDEVREWPISTPLGELLWTLRADDDAPLLHWLSADQPELAITNTMAAWVRIAGLRSPRTGKPLRLNPRRFRVTMLTNAADEGASQEHLAMLADHTDLQNIQVYIDRSPLFLERIRDKVDAIYDPMVKRFQGRFTTKHEAQARGGKVIPGVASHLPLLTVGGIGVCGHQSLCKLAPPLTCYTCASFVAFRDGPHEEVVAALEHAMQMMNDRVGLQIANALAAAREVVAMLGDAAPKEVT